jgi:hypothetical protein
MYLRILDLQMGQIAKPLENRDKKMHHYSLCMRTLAIGFPNLITLHDEKSSGKGRNLLVVVNADKW